jgi:hypothetical protein
VMAGGGNLGSESGRATSPAARVEGSYLGSRTTAT